MRELISDFLDTVEKVNTRKNYSVALEQFVTYLEDTLNTKDTEINVQDLKPSTVKKYKTYLATGVKNKDGKVIHYAKSSINQKLFAIESFFNFLIDDRIVTENIVKGVKAYKVENTFERLNDITYELYLNDTLINTNIFLIVSDQ